MTFRFRSFVTSKIVKIALNGNANVYSAFWQVHICSMKGKRYIPLISAFRNSNKSDEQEHKVKTNKFTPVFLCEIQHNLTWNYLRFGLRSIAVMRVRPLDKFGSNNWNNGTHNDNNDQWVPFRVSLWPRLLPSGNENTQNSKWAELSRTASG